MAVRTGMADLITRVRQMCNIGTASYSGAGTTFYSDQQIQDHLDRHSTHLNYIPLRSEPEYNSGGTLEYHDFYVSVGNLEAATSGSVYWQVYDQENIPVGTANYSTDYSRGLIRFTADTEGSAYYLRARTYDMNRAAAQIWREQAGFVAMNYDIQLDDQRLNRSQMHKHCMTMAAQFDKLAGARVTRMVRGDLR